MKITITNVDEIHDDLLIRSQNQELRVLVDGNEIYKYEVDPEWRLSKMPPSKWHIIPILEEDYGAEITVNYYTTYDRYQEMEPIIFYGSSQELVSSLTLQTTPIWLMGIIAILVGAISIMECLIYGNGIMSSVQYLGTFLVMFGIWSWGESKTYLFNYTNLYLQTYITVLLVVLMPIPLMLYFRRKATARKQKIITKYIYVCGIAAVGEVIVIQLGFLEMMQVIPFSQIILIIGILILIWNQIDLVKRHIVQREWVGIISVLMLLFAVIAEVFNVLTKRFWEIGSYAQVGVFLFIIGAYVVEVIEARDKYKKNQMLQKELERVNVHLMTDKMKPHFIHNSLLAIQELCFSDSGKAYEAIGVFSTYLRANLEGIGRDELIPFRKELEYLEVYMSLQEMCFEDAIEFKKDFQVMHFSVPPFSIQPIVENAVVHGIRKRRGM